jgi:hypothetical protein
MVRLDDIPAIEIDWTHFKDLDESYVEDLREFGVILLTLIKNDNVQLVAYDIQEQSWALMH